MTTFSFLLFMYKLLVESIWYISNILNFIFEKLFHFTSKALGFTDSSDICGLSITVELSLLIKCFNVPFLLEHLWLRRRGFWRSVYKKRQIWHFRTEKDKKVKFLNDFHGWWRVMKMIHSFVRSSHHKFRSSSIFSKVYVKVGWRGKCDEQVAHVGELPNPIRKRQVSLLVSLRFKIKIPFLNLYDFHCLLRNKTF